MAKRCPNGVICIENVTLFFILITIFVGLFLAIYIVSIYYNKQPHMNNTNAIDTKSSNMQSESIDIQHNSKLFKPNTYYSNEENDIFLNPHSPPLKENRFFPNINHSPPFHMPHRNRYEHGIQTNIIRGIPLNMSTSQYDFSYKQVGLLTRSDGSEKILPVFGRPLHTNRNKWQYYTMSDNNTVVKLPISKNGRSCTGDFGCDEIFNGDNVYVEGYKDSFDVTVYENNRPQYIPYL